MNFECKRKFNLMIAKHNISEPRTPDDYIATFKVFRRNRRNSESLRLQVRKLLMTALTTQKELDPMIVKSKIRWKNQPKNFKRKRKSINTDENDEKERSAIKVGKLLSWRQEGGQSGCDEICPGSGNPTPRNESLPQTPEAFRPGAKGPFRQHDPREFGLTEEEQFVHPRYVIPNLTFEPPDEGPRRRDLQIEPLANVTTRDIPRDYDNLRREGYSCLDIAERQAETLGLTAPIQRTSDQTANTGRAVRHQLPDITNPAFISTLRQADLSNPTRLYQDLLNQGHSCWEIAKLNWNILERGDACQRLLDLPEYSPKSEPKKCVQVLQTYEQIIDISDEQLSPRSILDSDTPPDITHLSFLACLHTDELANPNKLIKKLKKRGYRDLEIARFQRNLLELNLSGSQPQTRSRQQDLEPVLDENIQNISAPSFASPPHTHSRTRDFIERNLECLPQEQIFDVTAPSLIEHLGTTEDITDPRFIASIHPDDIANLPRFIHELEMQGYSKIQIARFQRNLLQSDLARSPAYSETPRQLFSARQEQHRTTTTPCIPLDSTESSSIPSQMPLVTTVELRSQQLLPDILSISFLSSIPPEDIRNPERLIADLYSRGYKAADIARFQEALLRLSEDRFPEVQPMRQTIQSVGQLESTPKRSPHDHLQHEDRPDITHLSFLACLRTDELENPCQLIDEFKRQGYTEYEIEQFRKNLLKFENSGSGDGKLPDVTSRSFLASLRPEDIKSPHRLFDDLYNRGYKPADIARLQEALLQLSGEKFSDVQTTPQHSQPITQLESRPQLNLHGQLPSEERPDITNLSFLACLRTEELENPCQIINQFERQGYAKWEIAKFQRNLLQLDISGMDSRRTHEMSSSRQIRLSETMQNLKEDRLEDISAPSFMAAPTPPYTPTRHRFERAIESAPCEQIENLSAPSFLATASPPPDITDPRFIRTVHPQEIANLPRFIHDLEMQGYSKVQIARFQRNLLQSDLPRSPAYSETPRQLFSARQEQHQATTTPCIPLDNTESSSIPSQVPLVTPKELRPERPLPDILSPSLLSSIPPEDIRNPERLIADFYNRGYKPADIARFQETLLRLSGEKFSGLQAASQPITTRAERLLDISAPSPVEQPFWRTKYPGTFEELLDSTPSQFYPNELQVEVEFKGEERPDITHLSFLACLKTEEMENPCQLIKDFERQGYTKCEIAQFAKNLLSLDKTESDIKPTQEESQSSKNWRPLEPSQDLQEDRLEDISAPSFLTATSSPFTATGGKFQRMVECAPDEQIENLSAPSFLATAGPLPDITDPHFVGTVHPEEIKNLFKFIHELELQGYSKVQIARFQRNLMQSDIAQTQMQTETEKRLPTPEVQCHDECQEDILEDVKEEEAAKISPQPVLQNFVPNPSQKIQALRDKAYKIVFGERVAQISTTNKDVELPDITSPSFLASLPPEDIRNSERLFNELYGRGYQPADIARLQEALLQLSGEKFTGDLSTIHHTQFIKKKQQSQHSGQLQSEERPDIKNLSFLACLRTEELENPCQLIKKFERQGYTQSEITQFRKNLLKFENSGSGDGKLPDVTSRSFLASLRPEDIKSPQRLFDDLYNRGYKPADIARLQEALLQLSGEKFSDVQTTPQHSQPITQLESRPQLDLHGQFPSEERPDITNLSFLACLRTEELENPCQLINQFERQGYAKWEIAKFQRNLLQLDISGMDSKEKHEKSLSSRQIRLSETMQNLKEDRLEDISAPSFMAAPTPPYTPTRHRFERAIESAPCEQIENLSAPSFLATASPLPDITDPRFISTVHPQEIANLPRFIHDLEMQGYSKIQIARFQRNLLQSDLPRSPAYSETPRQLFSARQEQHQATTTPCIPLDNTESSSIPSQMPLVTTVELRSQQLLPDILSISFLSSIPPEDIRNPERLIADLYSRGYKAADIARFQEALLRLSEDRFPEVQPMRQTIQSVGQLESTPKRSPHDHLQHEDRPDITHLSFLACLRTDELENPCQLIDEFKRQGYTEYEIEQFRKNLLKFENSGSGDGKLPDVTSRSFLASLRPEDIKSPHRLFDDLYNRGYKPADIARLQEALLQLSGEKFSDVQTTPQHSQPITQLESRPQLDLHGQFPSEERPDITNLSFLACLRTEELENPCQLINQFERQGYAKWEIAKFQRNLLQLDISGMDSRRTHEMSSSRQIRLSETMQNLKEEDRLEDISAPSFMAAPTPPYTPTRHRFERAIESAPCEQIENLSAPSFLATASPPPDITDPRFISTVHPQEIANLPRFIHDLEMQGYSKIEIARLQRNLLKADVVQGQPEIPEKLPVVGSQIKPPHREQFEKIVNCLPDDRLEDVSVPSFNETRPSIPATPSRGVLPSVTSPSFLASLATEDINNPENLYSRLYSQGYSCFDIAKLQRLILELPEPEINGANSLKVRTPTISSKRKSIRQYSQDLSFEDRPDITHLSFLACLRSEDLENPLQFVEKLRQQGYKEMELATFQRNLLRLDVPSSSRNFEATQSSSDQKPLSRTCEQIINASRSIHLEDVSAPSIMDAPSPPYTPTRERFREVIECAPDEKIQDLSAPSFLAAADPLPDITDPRYIDTINHEHITDLPKFIRELEMQGYSKVQLARFHLNLLRKDIERSQQQPELPEASQQTQLGRVSQKAAECLPYERLQLDPSCPGTAPTPSPKTSQIRQHTQDPFVDQRPDITHLSFLDCIRSEDLKHPLQLIEKFIDKGYNAMEVAIFQRNLLRLEITTTSKGSISRQPSPAPGRDSQDYKQPRNTIDIDEQLQNVSAPKFDKTHSSCTHTAARSMLPNVTSPSFLASIAPDDIINPEKLYQRLYSQGYTPFDIAKVQELLLELSEPSQDPGTSRPIRAPSSSSKTTQIHQYPQEQSSVQRPDITHLSFLACLRSEDLENPSQLVEELKKQGYNAMELAILQRNLLRLDVPSASRSHEARQSSLTQMPLPFTYEQTSNVSREVPLEDVSAPSFMAGPSPPCTPTRERFKQAAEYAPDEKIEEISAPDFSTSAGPLPDITNPNFIANLSLERLKNVSQLISEFRMQGYTQLQITRFQRNLINAQIGLPPPTSRTTASQQVAENEATANQSTPLPEIFNGNCVIDLPDENQRISNFRDAFETLENYAPLNVQLGNDKRFVSKLRRPTKLTLIPKIRSPKSLSTLGLSKIPAFKPRPFLQSTGIHTANRQQPNRFDPKPPTVQNLGQRSKTTFPKPYVKVSITSNLPNLQKRKISSTALSSTATGRILQQPNAPIRSQAPASRQNFPLRLSLKPKGESNARMQRQPFRF